MGTLVDPFAGAKEVFVANLRGERSSEILPSCGKQVGAMTYR